MTCTRPGGPARPRLFRPPPPPGKAVSVPIQYSVTHNLNVGRSVDETLRVLEVIQPGGLCGSDWKPGQARPAVR